MRGAFGLASILICALLIAYLWSKNTQTVAKVNKNIQPQVQKLAGREADGRPAMESIDLAPYPATGNLKGASVTRIDIPSNLQDYWGLRVGDIILEIGSQKVGDFVISDIDSARTFVVDGMQRQQPMSVNRGGVVITLPGGRNTSSTPGIGSGQNGNGPITTPTAEDILKQTQNP